MQTKQTLAAYDMITDKELKEALRVAANLVQENCGTFSAKFPSSNSFNQFYLESENIEWTTGFWTGQIWLAYEYMKSPVLLQAGKNQIASFLKRIHEKMDVNHHDMGFLYSPSCVAAYQLFGDEMAKEAALLAADQLLGRFCEKGQFFQAWGEMGIKENYRLIIDCLLNMPLLFWATEISGNQEYAKKARAHIRTAMEHVIRPDYSTYHTYFFDPETGAGVKGVTFQGNRNGSAWARGQAWGIYGVALSYRYMPEPEYADLFHKVCGYFLEHLPDNLIPYWDFDFDDGSDEPRDSSAAAISACGMLEMAKYLPKEESEYYIKTAKRLLEALWKHCAVKDKAESNGLLLHGTYARGTHMNPCTDRGVDECNTWGDYYYLEGLIRLSFPWNSYW